MKKIIFFGYTLEMGGAEKVLTDFLQVLKDEYEIDLALLQAKGELLKEVPREVTSITQLRSNLFSYVLFRYIPYFRKKKINQIANQKDYDIAIGFFEGRSATWVADIKKPIRRIAWIHNDVEKFDIGIGEKEIVSSYNQMDKIVAVSKDAKENFAKKYQIPEEKMELLYNMINENKIKEQAKEEVPKNEVFTFVNVGKMRPQKRQDRLIEIAQKLKQDGALFQIQIIGNGPEEENLKKLAEEKNVLDVVKFLGLQTNPYPYIKNADCMLVTSDFEGFGIAAKEALILGTPVIATSVTGIKEVLEDGTYGMLCQVDTQDLYKACKEVLDHPERLEEYQERLKQYHSSDEEIIKKLKKILEGN